MVKKLYDADPEPGAGEEETVVTNKWVPHNEREQQLYEYQENVKTADQEAEAWGNKSTKEFLEEHSNLLGSPMLDDDHKQFVPETGGGSSETYDDVLNLAKIEGTSQYTTDITWSQFKERFFSEYGDIDRDKKFGVKVDGKTYSIQFLYYDNPYLYIGWNMPTYAYGGDNVLTVYYDVKKSVSLVDNEVIKFNYHTYYVDAQLGD